MAGQPGGEDSVEVWAWAPGLKAELMKAAKVHLKQPQMKPLRPEMQRWKKSTQRPPPGETGLQSLCPGPGSGETAPEDCTPRGIHVRGGSLGEAEERAGSTG